MKLKIILLLIGFLSLSCGEKAKKNVLEIKKEKPRGTITLIFQKAPTSTFISVAENKSLGGRPFYLNIASYIDSEGIQHFIDPKRAPYNDTVNISTERKKIEINFEHRDLQGASYLFDNGDKILVTYENGRAKIKILNRPVRPFDYKFEELVGNGAKDPGHTPFEKYFRIHPRPETGFSTKEEYLEFFDGELRKNTIALFNELKRQRGLLDSLNKNKLLSVDIYDYYSSKLNYNNWGRLAKLRELPYDNRTISAPLDEKYDVKIAIGPDIDIGDIETVTKIVGAGDSLLGYKFYWEFLCDQFLPNNLENQTARITFNYGNFGGSGRRWDDVFDSVQKSTLFPDNVKEFLLYRYMDRISKDMSPKLIKEYYKKFTKAVSKDPYIDLINSKYRLDSTITDKLVLNDTIGNEYFLEDILEKNRGKVIFIEFWASWCAPCIEGIPHGNKLRGDYANSDLIYISVAFDKNSEEWKQSAAMGRLKGLEHNYVLKSFYLSNFIKKHHIIFVPRYMLIDMYGNMVDSNAPGPGDHGTRKLLDRYLAGALPENPLLK